MAIQILIGGVDYTKYVELQSVQVESNIAVTSDTCKLNVKIHKREIVRPKGGQEIKILNGSKIEFGGVVLTPKEFELTPDTMQYQLDCRDYTYWLDKRVVTNTYNGYTAGGIVEDIVRNFASGFTSNNVQGTSSGFYITQMKFDHVAPSHAIKKLADSVAFQWWVDYNKDVHFGPVGTTPSPLPGNTLYPDTDTNTYSDLEIDEDVSQVRNQVYLMGFKVPANYSITQYFTLDGEADTFYTTYEPKHILKDITVTVNGVDQKKALDIAGGLPTNQLKDDTAYIFYSNKSFRFNVAPAAGTMSITYIPMFEIVSMYNDPNAIAEMKVRDGQDGVYEFGIRDQQLTSTDQTLANTRGQWELYKYAYPHLTGQFNSYLQGWEPGQYFYITSNNRMDGELQKAEFYVIKVEKSIATHPLNGAPTLFYTVYFSDTTYVY